jgi:pyruvate,water dikinase
MKAMGGNRRVVRILSAEDPEALNPEVVGPKAAYLARLKKAGLNVPAFVVLVARQSSEARSLLEEHQLAELREKLPALAAGAPMAVRSSANLEDLPGLSLAGQLRTQLGVVGETALLTALEQCLTAAESPQVRSYLSRHGIHCPLELNLIVQPMVSARWSGVAFTAKGAVERVCVLIEASAKDSSAVTSGVACDLRLVYTRRPGARPRTVALVFGLPAEIPGTEEERQLWDLLGEMVLASGKALGLAGEFIDVEWVWDGRAFWILQARAATPPPLPPWLAYPPDQVWTNFFFTERYFHPLSTLAHGLLSPQVEKRAFLEPLRYLGEEELTRSQVTRLFGGRVFTKWEAFRKLHELIPPALLPPEKSLALFPDGVPEMAAIRRLRKLARVALRVSRDPDWLPWANLRRWRRFVPEYMNRVLGMSHEIERASTLRVLFRLLERGEILTYQLLGIHRWSLTFAELFERALRGTLRVALGVPEDDLTPTCVALISGEEENLTVQMHNLLARVRRAAVEERAQLAAEFLNRFGHRSSSLDIAEPTWREMPDILDRLPAPAEALGAGVDQRARAEAEVQRRVAALPRLQRLVLSPVLRHLLKYARRFAVLRENQRHYWHFVLAEMRRAALKIGSLLTEQGVLANPAEVFCLTRQELESLCLEPTPSGGFEVRRVVERRKRDLERWRTWTLPPLLAGQELSEAGAPERAAEGRVSALRGIGVSPGKAEGKAFFPKAYEPEQVPPGSVLVMPGLDPGWTPVLARIVGLVTESGGVLSHGAILAREFGVPAVASVAGALSVIRPGQWVRLDGSSGLVELRSEENQTDSARA